MKFLVKFPATVHQPGNFIAIYGYINPTNVQEVVAVTNNGAKYTRIMQNGIIFDTDVPAEEVVAKLEAMMDEINAAQKKG